MIHKLNNRNVTFSYLQAIAICMVIDSHTGNSINFLENIFPYNSFYMPLFVFISGYFFYESAILKFLDKKIRRLLIPYFVWNLISGIIVSILYHFQIADWGDSQKLSLWNLFIDPFIYGVAFDVNSPSWFVIMLFFVSICYAVIYKLFQNIFLHSTLFLLILFCGMNIVAVLLSSNGYSENQNIVMILKVMFYLPFYHIGYFYKSYFENIMNKISGYYICGVCIGINIFLLAIFGRDVISFPSTTFMNSFTEPYYYLPMITSLSGIFFWLEIAKFFASKIGYVTIIDFISRNTFCIMETHLLFANIPNFIFAYLYKVGYLPSFEYNIFYKTPWFIYNNVSAIFSFLSGLIGSILISLVIYILKTKFAKVSFAKILIRR